MESDGELMARSARGDDAAFAVIVRRYIRSATLLAAQLVGDRDEAEDIAQNAFMVVHRRLADFDYVRPFPPWLYGIIRRLANRSRTRAARRKRLWAMWSAADTSSPHAPAADVQHNMQSQLDAVHATMRVLPPMQRACFELVVLRDIAPADAAAMHGISESTVRQHVFRARKAIRTVVRTDT